MTTDRDLKNLVRARMVETGEPYTVARAALLAERGEAERFHARTMRSFFRDGRLVCVPVRRRARVLILLELLGRFEAGREYPEHEVNELLGQAWDDYAYLRRELVDYGFMVRHDGIYRVSDVFPEPGPAVAPEMPLDAERRFYQARRS